MRKISIVNGPNLNLLGIREPEIYGNRNFESYLLDIRNNHTDIQIEYYQSNIEGELINYLHTCMNTHAGIVLNAGAYTHTSIAIADAISGIGVPVVEVHISNIMAREEYRKTSFIASKCIGTISGLGLEGYDLAVRFLKNK